MDRVSAYAAAAMGVCRRDLAVFRSYRLRLVSTLLTTAFSLVLFYFISRLVHARTIGSPNGYYAYVVIGMVILGVLTSTLATPVAMLRQEVLTGTFERMALSPFGPTACVLSLMIFPLLLAFGLALFTIAFAGVCFGLPLHWSTAALGIPVALLGALAFSPFGVLMAIGVVALKQARSGASFVITMITVVSGIYFPAVLLPHWVRWLSDVQPFSPAVDLLRHVLIDSSLTEPVGVTLLKLILFPAVLLPVAVWAFERALDTARRHGTLTEY